MLLQLAKPGAMARIRESVAPRAVADARPGGLAALEHQFLADMERADASLGEDGVRAPSAEGLLTGLPATDALARAALATADGGAIVAATGARVRDPGDRPSPASAVVAEAAEAGAPVRQTNDARARVFEAVEVRDAALLKKLLERVYQTEVWGEAVVRRIVLPTSRETLLHAAARHGATECAGMLINEYDVPVDVSDAQGFSPLHAAIIAGRVEACRVLLRCGASVLAPTGTGLRPLHLVAMTPLVGRREPLEIAEMLLSHGARANLFTVVRGDTPVSMAIAEGNEAMVDLLRRAQAKRGDIVM
jgi:hypothetical protein